MFNAILKNFLLLLMKVIKGGEQDLFFIVIEREVRIFCNSFLYSLIGANNDPFSLKYS